MVFLRFHVLYLFHVTCRLRLRGTLEPETTQHKPEQTPDKELELRSITVYVSGYTETDMSGMLSPPNIWSFSVAM